MTSALRIALIFLAAATLSASPPPARAQGVPYNRSVHATGISYRHVPGGTGWEILVIVGAAAQPPEQNRDLSCFVNVSLNGVPLSGGGSGTLSRLILGWGTHQPWGNDCTMFCIMYCLGPPAAGVCGPNDGATCLCANNESGQPIILLGRGVQLTVPTPPPTLNPGDVIGVALATPPGGEGLPELYTPDDSASRVVTFPPCPADFTGDGAIDIRDYLAFLSLYAAGDIACDFNGDGTVNITDYLAFLAAFARGC